MPGLQLAKENITSKNDSTNKKLYDIWSLAKHAKNRKIAKPTNVDVNEMKKMISAGLIKEDGLYLEITEKGAQSLKVMILDDNTFSLAKKASTNHRSMGWYDKIKYEDSIY